MSVIKLDYSKSMINENEFNALCESVYASHDMLHNKSGPGSDFLGWLSLPKEIDESEISRLKLSAKKIQEDSDVLVVVGIGGSYLGARAVIEALNNNFKNELSREKRKYPKIFYAGQNISGKYLSELVDVLKDLDFSINVISKSGTTTEPAIAFRVLKKLIEDKYGKEGAKRRIYATTDKEKGALRTLADKEGYETFVIPDDVGGRYSVLTPVGLLPIATSGIDIDELLSGARDALDEYYVKDIEKNTCYKYALLRNVLYNRGKTTEIMVNYEPSLQYISEWWKQLYGESEGKDGKGLFPASVNFSTDLHSMGQYIQDGKRHIFETVIKVSDTGLDMIIEEDELDLDGLNYLKGKSLNYVNDKAFEGTLLAHYDGDVPNIVIDIEKLNPYSIGYLIYFFEKACAISAYILGVNPFNQPGVEAYKENMFALLNKPGFEEMGEELRKRI